MTLIERLEAMAKRREMEGIYTDANICHAAIMQIEGYHDLINTYAKTLQETRAALEKVCK